ncbi:MAG: hypothetical protein OEW09_10410, partial [Anaerolineae bacterium]|nr:hypothetical protein [Anaerolineae bacterium]
HLSRLRFWGQPLNRWLFFLSLLGIPAVAVDLVESGPIADAAVILACLSLMLALLWVGRTRYLIFRRAEHPSSMTLTADGPQLAPEEKVPVWASGHFEVSGMRRYFVEARAYFETVETREHIIIAWMPHRSLLGLAASPREEVGLWYVFFMPATIKEIEVGQVHFGLRPRPALKVVYQSESGSLEMVYLSFDHHERQEAVLADLRRDAPLP